MGHPSKSRSVLARRLQRGHVKKLQLPPFGKRRCVTPTENSTSPNRMKVDTVSPLIAPEARNRETETEGNSSQKTRIQAA
jgi:hypothetical protein